jgi:flagellar hook-associated protein 3 FlgL
VRVTDKQLFLRSIDRNAKNRVDLEKATAQASSGLRIEHPGDDPAAAGLSVTFAAGAARYKAIEESAARSSDELVAADAALARFGEVVARMQEISMQMANSSMSAQARSSTANEVRRLFEEAVSSLNTKYGGRFLFSGTADQTEPFDVNGNYVLASTTIRQSEIAPGQLADSSVRVDDMARGTLGGVDVLQAMWDLETALNNNDVPAILGAIDTFHLGTAQVSKVRADVGASMHLFDTAKTASRIARDAEQASVARVTEVDAVEAATRLALAQRALESSIAATAKSFELTLLKRI